MSVFILYCLCVHLQWDIVGKSQVRSFISGILGPLAWTLLPFHKVSGPCPQVLCDISHPYENISGILGQL